MEPSRYSVNQDGKEFILSTKLYPDRVKIECQDNNFSTHPNYAHDYTLKDLRSVSQIFNLMNTPQEVQTEIDNAIESQNVSINNKGDILEVTFTLEVQNHVAEITFQLPRDRLQYESSKFQKPTETQTQIVVNDSDSNNYYKYTNYVPVQREVETVVKEPIYKEESLPAYYEGGQTKNQNYQEIPQKVVYSNDRVQDGAYPNVKQFNNNVVYAQVQQAPDVAYSSGGVQAAPDVSYSSGGRQTKYFMGGCQCPLDHERINNLENATNNLKNDHAEIRARINALKAKIEMLKKQSAIIKNENTALNSKTLNLKQHYSQLIEAESAMRAENNALRKENQGLLLKKKQLEFYLNEHHDHSYVKEVNIPFEVKRHRPTAVSKKDKTFLSTNMSTNNLTSNYHKIDNNMTGSLYQAANLKGSRFQSPAFNTNTYSGSRMPQLNSSTNMNMTGSMYSKKL